MKVWLLIFKKIKFSIYPFFILSCFVIIYTVLVSEESGDRMGLPSFVESPITVPTVKDSLNENNELLIQLRNANFEIDKLSRNLELSQVGCHGSINYR